jgi:hypothetical protein
LTATGTTACVAAPEVSEVTPGADKIKYLPLIEQDTEKVVPVPIVSREPLREK